MADTKIVGGNGFGRPEHKHEHHEHERDNKVHVDHKTLAGNGTKKHPLKVIGLPGAPPFELATVIIYARTTGSDTEGDGTSAATAYRTMQRAVRDVPMIVPASLFYVVDITGIDEVVPDDYTLPAWKGPQVGDFLSNNPAPPAPYDRFFLNRGPVNIWAIPDPVPLGGDEVVVSASDCVITADPITGLQTITLNVPRPSWAAGATVKGKFLIGSGHNAFRGCAVIDSVDPTGQIITICNKNFNQGPNIFPITIMEPSAHIHGSGLNWGAINCFNVDQITFGGLKFTSDVGSYSLWSDGLGGTTVQLCELETSHLGSLNDGIVFVVDNRMDFCWIKGSPEIANAFLIAKSFVDAIDESFSPLVEGPCYPTFLQSVFRGCEPIRPMTYLVVDGDFDRTSVDHLTMKECLVDSGTGNGVEFYGSTGLMRNCDIKNCQGDGILCDKGAGNLELHNVGSSSPNGQSGTGVGINTTNGMFVQADAATSVTQPTAGRPLTGTSGDTRVGNLPVQTWPAFVGAGSSTYDITAVGPTGATGTGARLYT